MADNSKLNQLLKWSILNQATAGEDAPANPEEQRGNLEKLDPAIIDSILGKSEAQLMQEALLVIKSKNSTEDDKLIAWEDFEMLIQQIDNASNIENMKMWPAIIEELVNENPKFREQAAWVVGTATNNNPKAQNAFLKENKFGTILDMIKSDPEPYVRAKAVYALSGIVKHNDAALEEFKKLDGYPLLIYLLKNEKKLTLVRKVVFLLNNLLIQDPSISSNTTIKEEFLSTMERLLSVYGENDEDLSEKILHSLLTYFSTFNNSVNPEILHSTQAQIIAAKQRYPNLLTQEEWSTLEKHTTK